MVLKKISEKKPGSHVQKIVLKGLAWLAQRLVFSYVNWLGVGNFA